MTIIGGSALLLNDYIQRATIDIDIIDTYDKLQSILEKYDINNRSNAFIDSLAENYMDRLVKLDIKTKSIEYYTLSLEDLVIMKLHSDREKDYLDITSEAVLRKLNWDLLEKIVSSGEVDVSFNQANYRRFLERYDKYQKDYRK